MIWVLGLIDKGNTIYEVPYGFIIKDGVVNVK